ncbi:MAG: hypothetical protein LBM38_01960 [Clostridiales bacterium]|nr:hypothetical protein [Clostridiales bacterium]
MFNEFIFVFCILVITGFVLYCFWYIFFGKSPKDYNKKIMVTISGIRKIDRKLYFDRAAPKDWLFNFLINPKHFLRFWFLPTLYEIKVNFEKNISSFLPSYKRLMVKPDIYQMIMDKGLTELEVFVNEKGDNLQIDLEWIKNI